MEQKTTRRRRSLNRWKTSFSRLEKKAKRGGGSPYGTELFSLLHPRKRRQKERGGPVLGWRKPSLSEGLRSLGGRVDAGDLKSPPSKGCRFKSDSG